MGRRRQAREMALKILFQIDLGQLEPEAVLDYMLAGQKISPEVMTYIQTLIRGVIREWPKLDRIISQQAHHWKLSRIAGVDRNVLRLAAYELLHCPDVPKSVIINEAIEIVKKYSTQESSAFINGILDKLPRDKIT